MLVIRLLSGLLLDICVSCDTGRYLDCFYDVTNISIMLELCVIVCI